MQPDPTTRPEYSAAFQEIISRIAESLSGLPDATLPVKMYIAGGAAMHFYTGIRFSIDIDAAFSHRILLPDNLVLFQLNSDMFRATQRRQDKAQPAENGAPLSRAATPYWRRCVAPCGRAGKRSPAALHRLVRARHYRRGVPCAQPLPDPLNMSELS